MPKEVPVEKGKIYEIKINGLGHSGEGVGRYEEFTVFVPYALPNEIVTAEITEVKKSYAKGKLVKIIEQSPDRSAAKCPLYEECGGCQLQHLSYAAQLKAKKRQVADAVARIGGQKDIEIKETIGALHPWNYRNKMQFPVGRQGSHIVVGCYAQGSHKIINTESCFIQNEANNIIAREVRAIIKRLSLSPYDEKTGKGLIRHIIGRVSIVSGEVMVVIVTNGDVLPKQAKLIKEIRDNVEGVVSIMQNINKKRTNVIMGDKTIKLWGREYITDKLGDFVFNISARSFFQVNTVQAEVLYNKAVEYAELTGKETVIDAYCGTGTITLFLAKKAKKVYGIEIIAQAIADAKQNAVRNNIKNTEFITGDAVEIMPKLYEKGIISDVIVVDPPRAGCDKIVLETFAKMQPKRIVYVSCNPASLARDIAIMEELGYKAIKIQPVDMFAQTGHVETVCLMSRKDK